MAATLRAYGFCAGEMGRTEEAEGCYQRALAIQERTLGAGHPEVASTLHTLGACVGTARKTEEAEG